MTVEHDVTTVDPPVRHRRYRCACGRRADEFAQPALIPLTAPEEADA